MGVPSAVNVGGGLTGFVQTVIQPGVITELPMANMALSDDGRAMLDIDNVTSKPMPAVATSPSALMGICGYRPAPRITSFAIYGDPAKI